MKRGRWLAPIISLFLLFTCLIQLAPVPTLAGSNPAWGEYLERTLIDVSGQAVDEAIFPIKPPDVTVAVAQLPDVMVPGSVDELANVPAFYWSYGCSATSAAMLAGYYDITGYPNIYTGPTNGGVCPPTNSVWGQTQYPSVTCGECPLSASHLGIDGRTTKGSVDDYWIDYLNAGPDPYVNGSWTEHASDSLADFMGTNQAKYSNVDGGTEFWFATSGSPLYDYTGAEPSGRDGCHGLRLFFESRGYTVDTNYSHYIDTYKSGGFTFLQFQHEIDAGYPVLIQVAGRTMVGVGYDAVSSTIYVHDTWDYSDHTMTWGGSYAGMQQYGVTVIHPHPVTSAYITVTSPNGGENWQINTSHNITWNSANVGGNVNIELSRDNGVTWSALFSGIANDGIESWPVTAPTSTRARIRITSVDSPGVYDISNAAFTISAAPTRIIGLSGNLAFGSVAVGSSLSRTLSITNTGNSALNVTGISLPGGFTGNWAGSINAGGSHGVTVTFRPTSATAYSGTITVNSDKTSGTSTKACSGTGTAAATTRIIGLSGNLAFGSVTVGSSLNKTLTITNSGNSALTVISITCPVGFSGTWSGTIGAGGSQDVTIIFNPPSATTYGGIITVNSDMTAGTSTTACSGTGITAPTRIIGLSGDMNFGNVSVGSNLGKTLTISNSGNSALTVTSITCPTGFSSDWSGTILAGGSQDVTITFNPTSATAYSGTITVNSDMTSGANTLAASGTGITTPPPGYPAYTTGDDSAFTAYAGYKLCQTFSSGAGFTISSVKLMLYRGTTAPTSMTVSIYATTGSTLYPTGSALTSQTISTSILSTTAQWVEFVFNSPCALSPDTTYAIVLSGTPGSSTPVYWRCDASNPAYGGGSYGRSTSSGAWGTTSMDNSKDNLFQINPL